VILKGGISPMFALRKYSVRFALLGLMAAGAALAAPSAFARGHSHWGVSIGVPGVAVGYGWGGGYVSAYAPAYPSYYYGPSYYAPAYYADYYYPSYYYPSASVVYYGGGYHGYRHHGYYRDRGYRSHGYYRGGYRGHDYGHRASYYDRRH
jgi:hypothetical protein